jgi:acyl-[acyl-carrier-protein]-phospholipid O-acyltransferase/long-chain-fatty-acid--[acyl-carrier-protein] ligase
MLNFLAGSAALEAAATTAGLKTVLTSRRFIEKARLLASVDTLCRHAEVVFLEDVRAQLSVMTRLGGLLGSWRRKIVRRPPPPDAARKPAVILFTSGSEGKPKAVLLSHRNLMTNRWQLTARIAFTSSDRLLNALPTFHAFGLTGGLLLPVLAGVSNFQYPSPHHYPDRPRSRIRLQCHHPVCDRHLPGRLGTHGAPLRFPRRSAALLGRRETAR